ncbi:MULTISPECIES: transcriptional regulator BetI [Pseudoalteromonas]|uniref:HTH-type transcriptional regulator BetI n=1 Tax=Pseudoalteromonas rubra TaxID=43658 RepID=A0A5S3X473_9GAMM|nr:MULTISPECIES: transcriptional regulator BetI [Pseudoalteromonas]AZZ96137.1 transcriptional regulator BetI [Pseudoalteromonas sp. R3]TMP39226.1 transcriptional regulator BetI [Pseudoalteromonas rubra]
MPKVGMEPVRRQQLIEATLQSVAELGLQATTINSISKKAGMSSGIISHYFGGKQGLIEATVRYLLSSLQRSLLQRTSQGCTPEQRLMFIVEANFAVVQQQRDTTRTWLSFWAHSMHDPELHRLQRVNARRLYSNLLYSFKQLMAPGEAREAAELGAAMIDGLWLRAVLNKADDAQFDSAQDLAKRYIQSLIQQFGV